MSNGKFINLWVGQEAPPNISDLWLYPSNSGYQFRKFNRNTAQWVTSASQTVSAAEDMPAIGKVLLNTGKCLSAGAAASFLDYCKERNLGVEAVGIITGTSLPSSSEVSVDLEDFTLEVNSVTLKNKMYYIVTGGLTKSFDGSLFNSLATADNTENWNNIIELSDDSFLLLVGIAKSPKVFSKKVYSYSITSNSYTSKADNGFSNRSKLPIRLNNSIYVFCSGTSTEARNSELGIYNPSTNTWTTGKTLSKSTAQVLEDSSEANVIYLIDGKSGGNSEIIKYNAVTQVYSVFQSNLINYSGWLGKFTLNNKTYLVTDINGLTAGVNELLADFNLAQLLELPQFRPVVGVINNTAYLLFKYSPGKIEAKAYKITPGSYEISPYNPENN